MKTEQIAAEAARKINMRARDDESLLSDAELQRIIQESIESAVQPGVAIVEAVSDKTYLKVLEGILEKIAQKRDSIARLPVDHRAWEMGELLEELSLLISKHLKLAIV